MVPGSVSSAHRGRLAWRTSSWAGGGLTPAAPAHPAAAARGLDRRSVRELRRSAAEAEGMGMLSVPEPMMIVEDCLPVDLRGSATITRIAAGLSGAGIYRVESGGQVFVLKVAGEAENADDWRRALHIQ